MIKDAKCNSIFRQNFIIWHWNEFRCVKFSSSSEIGLTIIFPSLIEWQKFDELQLAINQLFSRLESLKKVHDLRM